MLTITVPQDERWDERNLEFIYGQEAVLHLEHSLVSVSKWESRWKKSFLSGGNRSREENLDYIRCMDLDEHTDETVYQRLTSKNIREISDYIESPMTATYLREDRGGPKNTEKITSELIYYWMIQFGIPFECENWHLNRLLTLIRVCVAKGRGVKRNKKDMLRNNAALNAARKAQLGSHG